MNFLNITQDIIRINADSDYNFMYKYMDCAQEIGYTVQYLMGIMVNENI